MPRSVLLVLQYDGGAFAGWQRQPDARTVQGVLEAGVERLCGAHVAVAGAGRTDAGVHATGQAAGLSVPDKWTPGELRRALNAVLPADVWVRSAAEVRPELHPRYSATRRAYAYHVGTDDEAESPFRVRYETAWRRTIDRAILDESAATLAGEHVFRAFAVQGTAPGSDDHRCTVARAAWVDRAGGLRFEIEANRFLHHMVRFIVGTMLDAASGRRERDSIRSLLAAPDNREVSAPAPAHGLYLERVDYPSDLYLVTE